MSPEQIERLRLYWGEGIPPLKRYLAWAGDFACGNMGTSLLYHQPVEKVIQIRFASSVWLMAAAWILSGVAGVILGMAAGARKGSLADRVISAYALVTASTPAFWVALVLLMVFAVWLKVLPVGLSVPIGADAAAVSIADRIRHGILPAAALSLTGISNITLHTREKMSSMESDYVLFARTRGESMSSIVLRHGLRNMILPALTLQFASINVKFFGGSVLVEQVFSYPGLGQAAVSAGLGSDMPLLMAITIISALFVFGGNLIANILYGVIDPRIRRGGAAKMTKNTKKGTFMIKKWNRRQRLVLWLVLSLIFLAAVCIGGMFFGDAARETDFARKNIAPCLKYPFGTDWLGRDMFTRTVKGLSISIIIGISAAAFSAVMAFILGVLSATMGKAVDTVITWFIDLVMGIPHMLLLILICVACGRG